MRWTPLRSLSILALLAGLSGCGRSEVGPPAGGAASAEPAAPALSGVTPAVASVDATGAPALAEDEPPPQAAGTRPVVNLGGVATPPLPPPEGSHRLAITGLMVRAYARPTASSKVVGYLRAGAVVEAEPEPAGTEGCPGGWRRLKPHGYVCVGREATLDLEHEIVRAASRRPDVTQKLPYMYGVVTRGGPAYARLPTEADLKQFEPSLKKHLAKWKKDEVSGAGYGLDVWQKWADKPAPPAPAIEALEQRITDGVPWFLEGGRQIPNLSGLIKSPEDMKIDAVSRRNGVAFVESFLYEGRRYNVSTDLRVIPADRFRPIRGSDFHGWEIGEELDFPFALVRRPGGKKWRLDKDAKKLVSAGELEWRSAVPLTGKQQFFSGKLHYETKDGLWVDDRHAGRVDP
ncbi:MAG TPA: hypothetical protein VLS89_03520, partial [Candidatus Nanopelagicales bacterium]|nr:hypothetical protein [Candidatus Nanopelagicales bacterium]